MHSLHINASYLNVSTNTIKYAKKINIQFKTECICIENHFVEVDA